MDTSADALRIEQRDLLAALAHVLEPLARIALARGLTIQATEEALRQAFVQAARQACTGANPDRLTSRISTMTGLTRREVARLTASESPTLPSTRSLTTEVLTAWSTLPAYTHDHGTPRPLPRTGAEPSFEALAAHVTRDVHPRSLLSEMVRLGLVDEDPVRGTVTLVQRHFVPSHDWAQMVGFLGANVGGHLQAAVDNVLGSGREHFEQALLADELSDESVQQARQLIAGQWQHLLSTLGPELQALMDADRIAGRAQNQAIRIGMYSWAHPMPTVTAAPQPPSSPQKERGTP